MPHDTVTYSNFYYQTKHVKLPIQRVSSVLYSDPITYQPRGKPVKTRSNITSHLISHYAPLYRAIPYHGSPWHRPRNNSPSATDSAHHRPRDRPRSQTSYPQTQCAHATPDDYQTQPLRPRTADAQTQQWALRRAQRSARARRKTRAAC